MYWLVLRDVSEGAHEAALGGSLHGGVQGLNPPGGAIVDQEVRPPGWHDDCVGLETVLATPARPAAGSPLHGWMAGRRPAEQEVKPVWSGRAGPAPDH